MSEVLAVAPLYQNVRTHSTSAGDILCTGKGCVGCNPENSGDKSIVQALGEVDSVHFLSKKERNFASKGRVVGQETTPSSYGNQGQFVNNVKMKLSKKVVKKVPKARANETSSILATKCTETKEDSTGKDSKMKFRFKFAEPEGKSKINNNFVNKKERVYSQSLTVPKRNNPHRKIKRQSPVYNSKEMAPLSTLEFKENTKTVDSSRRKYIQRKGAILYNTFPGVIAKRGRSKFEVSVSPHKLNFLEMLKNSEEGIYDVKITELDRSSKWVSLILEQGVKEEELFPKIPQVLKERTLGDGLEKDRCDKNTQTPVKNPTNLAETVRRNRFVMRGEEAIVIIEHEHDRALSEDDTSLHRLGFAMEHDRGSRNFPKFSILEIAESLEEFVHMKAIKVIQRRERRWFILVKGHRIKEFLIQTGLVLRGRHFELVVLRNDGVELRRH